MADVNAKKEDGSYVMHEAPDVEIQQAIKAFGRTQDVFELRGTKRFVPGDPLIAFLQCMRRGEPFSPSVWAAFEKCVATDSATGELDPRHAQQEYLEGYGLCMYWETLARWITKRARRDARALGVPLVFLQAADECSTLDKESYCRLLNVANIYNTGRIHGVLPAHVGMEVRFTGKFNASHGLVQEQRATVVDFVFHDEDARRYKDATPGEIFRPRRLPSGVWLQVDKFGGCPIWEALIGLVPKADLCRGLFCMPLMEAQFSWQSSQAHNVKRYGFMLTHAMYLTTTASQGQTLRRKVTVDCARIEPQGQRGTSDDDWWLNLYVMFSRATRMSDMLMLRPPPRALLERGPPASVRKALQKFERIEQLTAARAIALAQRFGIVVPGE